MLRFKDWVKITTTAAPTATTTATTTASTTTAAITTTTTTKIEATATAHAPSCMIVLMAGVMALSLLVCAYCIYKYCKCQRWCHMAKQTTHSLSQSPSQSPPQTTHLSQMEPPRQFAPPPPPTGRLLNSRSHQLLCPRNLMPRSPTSAEVEALSAENIFSFFKEPSYNSCFTFDEKIFSADNGSNLADVGENKL